MKKKVSIFLVFVLTMLILVGGINPQGVKALGNDDFVIGTKNLNNTPENSAEVKSVLKEPEIGWKRYDDRNSNITYFSNMSGDFVKFPNYSDYYNGTLTQCKYSTSFPGTSYIKFNFTGDKLRIIGDRNQPNYGADIIIDGKNTRASYNRVSLQPKDNWQSLIFEVRDLDNGEHSVIIETKDQGFYLNLDAIDVDEEGELRPFQEIENVVTESISLDKTSMNLLEGSSEKLAATVLPDNATNKKVLWTSSDTNIATVDENGNVTAVKEGQATIMAKVEGTELTDTCVVNVTKAQLPEETGNAILSISLVSGSTKQYDVSMEEVNKFIQWYETRTKGEGTNIYAFSKNENPYKEIKEYIAQDKIASFEVKEYVSAN